jgi:hypothetical protein
MYFYHNNLTQKIIIILMIVFCIPVLGQDTTLVTMQVNTSTNPDTVMENHVAQIRGECTGVVVPAIAWDNTTELIMENTGGDYWEITFKMIPGDTLRFKFWTGFDNTTSTFFNWGYEGPINPADPLGGDSRSFIAGTEDTTLALQFYHGTEAVQDQFWRPYEEKVDSFAIYFRVNMIARMETQEFDPETDQIVVFGGPPIDPTDSWDVPVTLAQEEGSSDNAMFSGLVYIDNDSVEADDVQQYQFVYIVDGTENWEPRGNRQITFSGPKDTTIHFSYWNDQKGSGGNLVEADLTWSVKMDGLEKLGYFDRGLGETIVIDGATGWDVDNAIVMTYSALRQMWIGEETFLKAPGASFEYKPVLLWDDSRIDPASENYIPGLELETPLQYWEEPALIGSGNRTYVYTDQTTQSMPGDFGFEYQYFNGLPEEGVIETPVTVHFSIDMTPATVEETNPSNPLFRPGIDSCEIYLYGCLMGLTQGYGLYGDSMVVKLEDPNSDLIYTASYALVAPTTYSAGYRVKYIRDGVPISNGGGNNEGRSYYQFIHPDAVHGDGSIDWPSEFTFPTLEWMATNLTVEDPPELFSPTGMEADKKNYVTSYELGQNYPNPFNPETTIKYSVAEKTQVRIEVYNITGQLIKTLFHAYQTPGKYSIQWNGKDMKGNAVASGMYFVKMKAGSFENIRKMVLIR